jgi:hypothetical protein
MRIAFDGRWESEGFLHLMEREGFLVAPKPVSGEGGSRA